MVLKRLSKISIIFAVFVILFTGFQTSSFAVDLKDEKAYFDRYDGRINKGGISALSRFRVVQMYIWNAANVSTKKINGSTIESRITTATNAYKNLTTSDISYVSTTNYDNATVRIWANDPYLDALGSIRPIYNGAACAGDTGNDTGVEEQGKYGFDCKNTTGQWDYVKVYINVDNLAEANLNSNQVLGTISHELGHALGLRHQLSPTSNTIMKTGAKTRTWYAPQTLDANNLKYRYSPLIA